MARLRRPDEAAVSGRFTARRARERDHPAHAGGALLNAYFDSGVVTKWYIPEPDSPAALALRTRFRPPLLLTHLHRVELVTAWKLKVFRREIPAEAAIQAEDDLQADIDAGVWLPPDYDLHAVFATAQRLARRHAASLGTRTLDTLHVAAAQELGCPAFVTRDGRQAKLATAVGLSVTMP